MVPAEVPQPPPSGDRLELRSRVPARHSGQTLIEFLCERFRYHDRARWIEEIAAGRIRVDGAVPSADQPLRGGATIGYSKAHVEPWVSTDVRIVHRGSGYVVVEKPPHLPMHADGPFVRNTLVHLLRSGPVPTAEIVHRLDRETSGLCVVACHREARADFERQFRAGTVRKAYLAVAIGVVAADFTADSPIGRCPRSCISLRRSAAPDALEPRPASTSFHVLQRGPRTTLLRCEPTTGRTHQIRVHLEAAGHPLLGDVLYGRPDADYLEFVTKAKETGDGRCARPGGPDRQLLHAAELGFREPGSGRDVSFRSAAPEEFAHWLANG